MTGFRLFDGIHRQGANRIGHTGGIDARHDEIPPEMRCLERFCTGENAAGSTRPVETSEKQGLDSICTPGSPRAEPVVTA
jgi:hypothetical protein